MESLWKPLTAGFLKRIEKELGEEVTLGLLWPQVVGPELARNTRLKAIRRGTLIVTVPDREWLKSIGSIDAVDRMILEAIGRLGLGGKYDAVEFVVSPSMAAPGEGERAASPHVKNIEPAAPHGVDTTVIADESLRSRFENSAKKYFAHKPHSAPGTRTQRG